MFSVRSLLHNFCCIIYTWYLKIYGRWNIFNETCVCVCRFFLQKSSESTSMLYGGIADNTWHRWIRWNGDGWKIRQSQFVCFDDLMHQYLVDPTNDAKWFRRRRPCLLECDFGGDNSTFDDLPGDNGRLRFLLLLGVAFCRCSADFLMMFFLRFRILRLRLVVSSSMANRTRLGESAVITERAVTITEVGLLVPRSSSRECESCSWTGVSRLPMVSSVSRVSSSFSSSVEGLYLPFIKGTPHTVIGNL